MALPPVVPSDTAAIVPQPGDPACTVLSNMVQGLTQWNAFISWLISEDGSITQDAIDAFGVGGTNALAAPTGVSASEDRTSDVTITWNAVSDASYYVVYRGTTDNTGTMTVLSGNLTDRTYVDTSPTADTSYWYAVRAYSSSRVSTFSATDRGIMPSSAAPTTLTRDFTYSADIQSFTVPASPTYATLEVQMWGSGGSGGRFLADGWVTVDQLANAKAGGGGASGSFLRITGITATPGETYYFKVGKVTDTGVDGSTTIWRDEAFSSEYATAPSGNDGRNGNLVNPGAGGTAAASYGSNAFGSGTIDSGNSTVGSAGSAGSGSTGGAGGTGVTYSGVTAGGGGAGLQVTTAVNPGSPGYIRLIFRT